MFFLINKPSGVTSYSFAEKFAKKYGFSKFGHTGTLDALATGALLIAVGPDTKLISYITDKTKCYEAVAILGYSSDTLDITGNITTHSCNTHLTVEELQHAMKTVFVRTRQMPPEYSAKKIKSARASDIARRGGTPALTLVDVTIHWWELMDFNDNILRFRVKVSNGTYVRSLIRDIGDELGCKAVMIGLHRYKIGRLTLRGEIEKIDEELLFEYPAITLEEEGVKGLLNGRHQILQQLPYGSVKKILYRQHMVGIYSVSPMGEKKIRMFGKKVASLIQ